MSQVTYYKCDGCGKPTGEVPHISIVMQNHPANGISLPPHHPANNPMSQVWYVSRFHGFKHFHSGACAKIYFDREMKRVLAPKKKVA